TIRSMGVLVDAAFESCSAGLDLVKSAQMINTVIKAGFFASGPPSSPGSAIGASLISTSQPPDAGTPAPPLDAATLAQLQRNINDAFQHLNTAVSDARGADLSLIPSSLLKPKQVAQLYQLLASWPQIQEKFALVDTLLDAAPELLGVKAPENFLLEL